MSTISKHNKNYLDNIINLIPYSIFWKDRNSAFLGCNKRFAKLAGLNSPDEIIGKTDYDLPWKKEESDAYIADDREIILTGKAKLNIEEPQTLADGQLITLLTSKAPLLDENDQIIGVVVAYTDITVFKKAQEENEQAKKQIELMEQQVQLFKQLSGTVAHELNTPLRGIQLGAETIQEFLPTLLEAHQAAKKAELISSPFNEKDLESVKISLSNMVKEIDAAFLFIEMLLANIRAEKFTGEDKKEICFMQDIIEEVLERYPLNYKQKEKIAIDNTYNFSTIGSRKLLIHVLFNLLKNALYYIDKASKGQITVWCEEKQKFNELHFKDTGTGISKDVLPHIFDPFFSKTLYGTGIGLTYCKMVMDNFHGSITCKSTEGEYTEFILSFPKN